MEVRTVRTQKELDEIPSTYAGEIVIDGGSAVKPIKIWREFKTPLTAIRRANISVRKHVHVTAKDNVRVWAYEYAQVEAYGNATVIARHHAKVRCFEHCRVSGTDESHITAFGDCTVTLWKHAKCHARGRVHVRGFDRAESILHQNSRFIRHSDTAWAQFKDRAKEIKQAYIRDGFQSERCAARRKVSSHPVISHFWERCLLAAETMRAFTDKVRSEMHDLYDREERNFLRVCGYVDAGMAVPVNSS